MLRNRDPRSGTHLGLCCYYQAPLEIKVRLEPGGVQDAEAFNLMVSPAFSFANPKHKRGMRDEMRPK